MYIIVYRYTSAFQSSHFFLTTYGRGCRCIEGNKGVCRILKGNSLICFRFSGRGDGARAAGVVGDYLIIEVLHAHV